MSPETLIVAVLILGFSLIVSALPSVRPSATVSSRRKRSSRSPVSRKRAATSSRSSSSASAFWKRSRSSRWCSGSTCSSSSPTCRVSSVRCSRPFTRGPTLEQPETLTDAASPLDGTLVVQLVNFVVFLLILNGIFLKPVGRRSRRRRAYIDRRRRADIEQFESDLKSLRVHGGRATRAAAASQVDARRRRGARTRAERSGARSSADHQAQASAIVAEAQATVALEIARSARQRRARSSTALARTMLERAVEPGERS